MKLRDVLVVGVAVLAGCSGGGTATPPVESTSGTVTTPAASASGTTASPSASQSVSPSQDPLYLEAVEVYKKLYAEERKLLLAGGAKTLPPSMTALLAEPALTDFREVFSEIHRFRLRLATHPVPVLRIAPNPGVARGESVVSLRACEDATDVTVTADGKPLGKAELINRTVFFVRGASGSLIVSQADDEAGTKCNV